MLTALLLLGAGLVGAQVTSTLRYQEGYLDPNKPADPSLTNYYAKGQTYRPRLDQSNMAFDSNETGPTASSPMLTVISPTPFVGPTPVIRPSSVISPTPSVAPSPQMPAQDPGIARPTQGSFSASLAHGYQQNPQNPGFIGPIVPQPVFAVPENIPLIVDVEWLNDALLTRKPIKVLDATASPRHPPVDYKVFRDQYYGNWDRLFSENANADFQRAHIPNSVHFNLDIATYPAWNDPSALYPPDLFQEYVRRLGINQEDHLVIYSRGSLGGALESARVWNLFRIYGHQRLSILDGGLGRWMASNFSISDMDLHIELGNWTAAFDPGLVIGFDELSNVEGNGYCLLNKLYWYNFLDARPKPEFIGLDQPRSTPTTVAQNPPFVGLAATPGIHLPGAKSLPAEDLVRPDGKIYPPADLMQRLRQAGYVAGRESVAAGNTPEEASMVVLALAMTYDSRVRLYNAGILELKLRSLII
ncbi:unnamed protein product [Bursaphelenchus okinawaensis]|uniref:Rhodanese domain-containing protein n=1 Tax=Bursaphelenchus okinawaensis TaxID=465554 RepID=A0A811LDI9_9BILA|nr:unnamed protein product [Bursaphelenchus okinawaensis]CAG9120467.1 unnamed protein product [Bursaphelenchus okinawaensis]